MSLRKAINNKCKDCIVDKYSPGNWKQQVSACMVVDCPLFPVRPRSEGDSILTSFEHQKRAELAQKLGIEAKFL